MMLDGFEVRFRRHLRSSTCNLSLTIRFDFKIPAGSKCEVRCIKCISSHPSSYDIRALFIGSWGSGISARARLECFILWKLGDDFNLTEQVLS